MSSCGDTGETKNTKLKKPGFLSQYMLKRFQSPAVQDCDIQLQCFDGSVFFDLALLCAASEFIRYLEVSVDSLIFIENTVRIASLVKEILYTGKASTVFPSEIEEVKTLVNNLKLNIGIIQVSHDSVDEENNEASIDTEILTVYANECGTDTLVNDIQSNTDELGHEMESFCKKHEIKISCSEKIQTELSTSSKMERNQKIFLCDLPPCYFQKLAFVGLSRFKKHTRDFHRNKPLACPENNNGCTFRADDYSKLSNHVQGVHRDVYATRVKCKECDKEFPSQSYLRTHLRRMHGRTKKEREQVCPFCGQTKLQLNDHIMRAHKSQHFKCDFCPKKFKTSVQRRIHHNVHTGFKPYTCASCDQQFARLHHRKVHLEKMGHTPGPVLKPEDHVDYRSAGARADKVEQDEGELERVSREEMSQTIGVNCAEIIQNITIGTGDLDF